MSGVGGAAPWTAAAEAALLLGPQPQPWHHPPAAALLRGCREGRAAQAAPPTLAPPIHTAARGLSSPLELSIVGKCVPRRPADVLAWGKQRWGFAWLAPDVAPCCE